MPSILMTLNLKSKGKFQISGLTKFFFFRPTVKKSSTTIVLHNKFNENSLSLLIVNNTSYIKYIENYLLFNINGI